MLRLDLTHIPKLSTARLILRELVDEDTAAIFQLRSNPEVMRFIPKPLNTHTDEAWLMIREFHLASLRNESIMWGITVKGSNMVMGYIGFWRIMKEYHRAEIGYALHPDLWGQGLMSEAVAATMEYGFQEMGLHSVEASVRPDNPSSIQVLERNNFVKEGHFKENIRAHGMFVDSVIYSRLSPVKATP